MRYAIILLAAIAGICASSHADPITTASLIEEMADMHRLAEFPAPFYKTVQYSSYDHRSSHPGGPDWFANSDGFGGEPAPNFEGVVKEPGGKGIGEYLVCDVEGPGAIVRTWSARMLGHVRMYLDGNPDPVFDGTAEDFLMRTYRPYAEDTGIDGDVLGGTFYQRNAAYCPIPFEKRCRIVWIGALDTTHFYQVQIRLYDKDAEVVTFRPEDLRQCKKIIRRIAKTMSDPDNAWEYKSKDKPVEFAETIEPGKTKRVLRLDGPKAIERLSLRVNAGDLDKALRQTLLHISCDGFPWGQVQAPAGDFFGAAPGVNPYSSVPFTVAADGTMTCRYVMPFEKNIEIAFENLGDRGVEVTGEALPVDYEWDAGRSMHFRARWRIDHGLVGWGARVQDLPFLIANGAGVYVGTAAMILNPNRTPTPGGNWWGEGDEKIFSDEDVRPSTFGTGSEDYFNYAWSSNDIFLFPYCGQPRNDGPANRGFVTNDRWHILDTLPFKQRLSFYMELFTHQRTEDMSYARIAYHYARPGMMDDHVAITDEDVRHLELPKGWIPESKGAARNSVFFQAEDLLGNKGLVTLVEGNLWSGGKLARWTPKAVGEELVFTLPIAEDGAYDVRLCAAHDPQSGTVSMSIDGTNARLGGEHGIADLYVPHRTMLRNVGGRHMDLTKGDHTLTLRFEGASGKSIGIDYVWVQKR